MTYYIKQKLVEWSNNAKINHYLPTPPGSPGHSPTGSMSSMPYNNGLSTKQHQHRSELGQETPRSGSPSFDPNSAFDNVTQTPVTGRLSVTIVEGRKLNVSNFQARPYCVVEFERNEFVTREAIRDCELPSSRNGKIEFLDLVRAATSPVWKQKAVFDVARLDGQVHVLVYERVPDHTRPEVFLGMLKIQPPRSSNDVVDGWFKLLPRGKEMVTGELHIQIAYEKVEIEKSHLKPSSFEVLKLIGKGNFGKVFQVRKKDTNRIYAMKVLHKQDLIERREVEHTLAEKNILIQAEACPFLVGLKFSFQTKTHLYLVTDFMNGALCDFGLCKENLAAGQTTNTFCGTSEYLAPEVLAECGYGKSVDWWSLGILFYEMIAGFSPFYTNDTQLMYRKILFGKLKFPKGFFSEDAKSLIKGLLARNPNNRLGSHNDAEEIKNHPFFANIDWDALYRKQVSPPFKPNVSSEDDTSCFDPSFTEEETSIDWPSVSKNLSRNGTNASINSEMNEAFGGFTYSGENQYGLTSYPGCSPLGLDYDLDIGGSPSSSSSSSSGSWRNLDDALGY
ncbi:1281_t:CDS:2 [Cetraspora pellucida]|uniref:non-specific serine/threonine protein kinase n=1 Tax=Cetraspora pellucida TaxID=1433469 RepID=A0A9N9A4B0_9GLOM|nr:1281_t:CDS:2 [Cetraspora pellucida]